MLTYRGIRSLFDHIQRDLEFKWSIKKPLVTVMARIGYASAFKNINTFEINITRIKKFLEKAIPVINTIGIIGKGIDTKNRKLKRNLNNNYKVIKKYTIKYEISCSYITFRRDELL